MRYVLAISGGVDSVVLLDVMSRTEKDIVVAHFDHGIRQDSAADARFVEALAAKYRAQYIGQREELGADASEEQARERRYAFLNDIAADFGGTVATAHHQDDIVETVALNLRRGARWRGLAGMSDSRILRPLSSWTKQQIYEYAAKHRLEWCEDETNNSEKYTRNILRRRIHQQISPEARSEIYELWRAQRKLRRTIEAELKRFDKQVLSRHFLIQIEENVALELLYYYILRHAGASLLTAQLERMLVAIKTGRPGTVWQLGSGAVMKLTARDVIIDEVD